MSRGAVGALVLLAALGAAAGCETATRLQGEASRLVTEWTASPGDARPLVADLKPGPYQASSLAVGEEKDLARQRGEGLGFVPAGPLDAYLGRVRARLVEAAGVTGVPGRVVVLANPAFAAYTTPDGNVYLAMGWMPYLDSEDEVAAILAHELGHVLLAHHDADLVAGAQQRARSFHELGVAARMAAEKRPAPSAGEQRAQSGWEVAGAVAEKLVLPAWSRRQEREADLLGVDLLVRAGYSPVAMVTMLEKHRAWEAQIRESEEAFQKRAGELARTDLTAALAAGVNRVVTELSASHPDTGRRLEDIAAYLDRHHGALALPEPRVGAWNELRRTPAVHEVLQGYDRAFSARKLLERGRVREAHDYARAAAAGRTATHAYPNWVLARAALALGRQAEAVAALERAIKANEPIREVYDEMIAVNERAGRLDAALAWTDRAATTFGDSARWMPVRIRLLRKLGRTGEASTLTLRCAVETPDWKRLCDEANQTPAGRGRG